ncbi:endoplasmic reticulum-based factor for assembly of V-ATPase-domain-containing protein [Lasiosphaeris hirsuta]|uniref:Endoplasmic reticulum-based factor for assembly of V-ATPase-domain-containing protein n=1 Tax=Lasiosphaeris hirsuta TaxID=260670 RepID=A0AA40B0V9_9PEZI|nr:endoplasmic reticulum-based factor for assembly of V-ATPase-domain-containing protein [Lasiosphaeris hirsuta]
MVLLTATPSIMEGLQLLKELPALQQQEKLRFSEGDPSLDDAAVGTPISHGQIVDLWTLLKDAGHDTYTLERLLKGSNIYIKPPPPKPEPSKEYKALMARLRRDEEQRIYDRMANPLSNLDAFAQRIPSGRTNMASAFAEVNRPGQDMDLGDDDVTLNDVHRQMMLILNVVVSILGVAATLWIVARWWSTPARLFLTMGGSLLVGVAEVAVYSGYIWHLGEAKKKDKTFKEVKEVVQTWVVGQDKDDGLGEKDESVAINHEESPEDANLRRRRKGGLTSD